MMKFQLKFQLPWTLKWNRLWHLISLLCNHLSVHIAGIHILQEMFANDMLTALKPSLQHELKQVLRLLLLYGDQT